MVDNYEPGPWYEDDPAHGYLEHAQVFNNKNKKMTILCALSDPKHAQTVVQMLKEQATVELMKENKSLKHRWRGVTKYAGSVKNIKSLKKQS